MNPERSERIRILADAAKTATGDERSRLVAMIERELDADLMELQGVLFAPPLQQEQTGET